MILWFFISDTFSAYTAAIKVMGHSNEGIEISHV